MTAAPIQTVYVATHRKDLRLTRICVASIRRWHPDVAIRLLKDLGNGPFSTAELEDRFGVTVFDAPPRRYGWGFIKLLPLFRPDPARFLVLDSDTALLGPLLDRLAASPTDFVVDDERQPDERMAGLYFDLAGIKRLDPAFAYPGFSFNSGQWVGRGGVVSEADFAGLVDWAADPPRVAHPDVFNPGEQGVLNYVLMRKAEAGELALGRVKFMLYGADETRHIDVSKLGPDSPYPYLIHWAGMKKPRLGRMLRADILEHFERLYYSRVPLGTVRRHARAAGEVAGHYIGRAVRRATRLRPPAPPRP